MTTINHNRVATGNTKAFVACWPSLVADGDVGDAITFSQYSDKSVQVEGTFGGATLRLEGSNDGSTFYALTDPQGNDLNFVSAKIEQVTEVVAFVRPRVIGGTGVNLTVHLLCKE